MICSNNLILELPDFTLGPLTLQVRQGAFFALMGPTGSGKTLLLESLAGLIRPHKGSIHLAGRNVDSLPPEERRIGLVYQDHSLFPHMSVLSNITYGQRYHHINRAQGMQYASELMDILELTHLAQRKPTTLSGGEKQRTSLARALACKPDIVLLDEPLSSLDPQFREGLRQHLKELHAASGATFFMVTHDFMDALTLADTAAVIRHGRIEQDGTTSDIFHRPATTFIADFVGMKNVFPATFHQGECSFSGLKFTLRPDQPTQGSGHLALRPEDLHIALNGDFPREWLRVQGKVESISRVGFTWLAKVSTEQASFTAQLEHRLALDGSIEPGSGIVLAFDPEIVHCIID